jgi:hypothetical protein
MCYSFGHDGNGYCAIKKQTMKNAAIFILCVLTFYAKAQLYKSTEGTVSFFSETAIENIDATSKNIESIIDCSTNEIVFSVAITSFQFRREKMQEDFNEDYMESDKYRDATYKGKINEKINWKKDGTYKITSQGVLTIHGVAKERTDTGTVSIQGGKITMKNNFLVRVADHGIKIPQLVLYKVAEVVSVKVAITYVPYSK